MYLYIYICIVCVYINSLYFILHFVLFICSKTFLCLNVVCIYIFSKQNMRSWILWLSSVVSWKKYHPCLSNSLNNLISEFNFQDLQFNFQDFVWLLYLIIYICMLAWILAAYCLFISTYKAHINAVFCITLFYFSWYHFRIGDTYSLLTTSAIEE